jgi:hypothetical protein
LEKQTGVLPAAISGIPVSKKLTNPETAASDGVSKLLTYEPTAYDQS